MNTRQSLKSRASKASRPVCEGLETRQLLSSIVWVNRGVTTGASNDRFNDVFGSLANQARAVVDADIAYWQRTITNFNYSNGTDTYNLTISMNSTAEGTGAGGVGANTSTTASIGTKPSAATIGIGWRSQVTASGDSAAGWYLDPTPFDNSEFQGTLYNAFAQNVTSGGPNGGGFDLLPIVMHEMGHAMGLYVNASISALATDTGVIDTLDLPAASPPAHYYRFDGPDVKTLFTGYDTGGASGGATSHAGTQHAAPPGAAVTVGGTTYYGNVELMKPYVTERAIISNNDALVLKDAFGYTVTLPSTFGTFYDQVDSSGELRITGTSGNDTISVVPSGTNLVVTMTLGTPIAGIDPTSAFSSTFAQSSVHSIDISALGGNDTITLPFAPLNQTYSIDGGNGTDSVTIDDSQNVATPEIYTQTPSDFTRTKGGDVNVVEAESVLLKTGTNSPTVNVHDAYFATTIQGQTSGFVNIGDSGSVQGIVDPVKITNPPSFTSLFINDSTDLSARTATLSDGSLTGLSPGAITWNTTDVNGLSINGGTRGNTFFIASASSSYTTYLSTGSGNDLVQFTNGSSNAVGLFSIDGQAGTNDLILTDVANTPQTYTITDTGFSRANLGVTENNIEPTAINAGPAADIFNVNDDPDGATLNLSGGAGVDTFNVGVAAHAIPKFGDDATFDGGTDGANITFDDSGSASPDNVVITSNFFDDGDNINYFSMNNFTFDASPSLNSVEIAGATQSTNYIVNGGSGSDTFYVGTGNLSTVLGHLTINPNGGTDSLTVDDHSSTTARTYNVTGSSVGVAGFFSLNYGSGLGYLTVSGGSGNDTVQLAAVIATIMTFNLGSGNDTLNVNSGSYFPTADLGAGTQNLTLNVTAPGQLAFQTAQHLAALNLIGNTYVAMFADGERYLETKSLSLATGSTLDMYNNDLIVDYTGATPIGTIQSLINTARGTGAFTGTGLTSTSAKSAPKDTTLGVMEATDYKSIYGPNAMFDGQMIDNTAVLIKYTYYGDANFNGQVDGGDYARLDFTFGQEAGHSNIGGWINGDFNGDGKVDGSDYGLIDFAFSSQGNPLDPPLAGPTIAQPPVSMGNLHGSRV